jgi:hypothetical protein
MRFSPAFSYRAIDRVDHDVRQLSMKEVWEVYEAGGEYSENVGKAFWQMYVVPRLTSPVEIENVGLPTVPPPPIRHEQYTAHILAKHCPVMLLHCYPYDEELTAGYLGLSFHGYTQSRMRLLLKLLNPTPANEYCNFKDYVYHLEVYWSGVWQKITNHGRDAGSTALPCLLGSLVYTVDNLEVGQHSIFQHVQLDLSRIHMKEALKGYGVQVAQVFKYANDYKKLLEVHN